MEATLTFSPPIQGWPSFYSYQPDMMIGMNNYFYTFKGGNLYRHNTNETRNKYYGVQYPSTIKTVFNENPLDSKLFKTIVLIGDSPWDVTDLYTDLQEGFFIESAWFALKEASYFAFIRNRSVVPASPDEYALRSLSGIGRSLAVTGAAAATHIEFSISPLISIGSIISVGDYLYFAVPPYTTPVLCGLITNVVQDYPNGDNYIEVNTTVTGGSVPTNQTDFMLFMKNTTAESQGLAGHFCTIELENNSTSKIELFVISSETMVSFPKV